MPCQPFNVNFFIILSHLAPDIGKTNPVPRASCLFAIFGFLIFYEAPIPKKKRKI